MLERIRSLFRRWVTRLATVSVKVDDTAGWGLLSGGGGPADRDWWEIREDLTDALEAWRRNAWVRQVVRLCTAYVVGDGIKVSSRHKWVTRFVTDFWTHRQNRISERLAAWNDELVRSGELFIALFPNQADGMQYVRAVPASQISRVETDPEDYERETGYVEIVPNQVETKAWKSQHTALPTEPCLLHFAVNKPVGATRGESDLVPLLPWARRYTDWLRDRVKLNRVRTELAVAEIVLDDDTQVDAKRNQYKANPPTSGSIYVHGKGEELRFPAANIAAFEASDDGKSLRLAMGAAADIPLHFFSEGDSATRATAVEMGDPTHRFYRQRQQELSSFLVELVAVAFRRRQQIVADKRMAGVRIPEDLGLVAEAADISRADNQAMAQAANTIVSAFAVMAQHGWITDELAVRLAFKFAGEILSEEQIQEILLNRDKQDGQDGQGQEEGDQGSGSLGGNGRGGAGAVLDSSATEYPWGGDRLW